MRAASTRARARRRRIHRGTTVRYCGGTTSVVGSKLRMIGVVVALAGLGANCSQYNAEDDPRVIAICTKLMAENSANPPLRGQAFRYMERDGAKDAGFKWPQDSTGGLCEGPCQEMVGHFGYSLYIYVSNEEIKTLQNIEKTYNTKRLKEWKRVDSPGIYRFSPANPSDCDAKEYFSQNGQPVPNACPLPEKIDDHELSKISNLPVIVVDRAPLWLPIPKNPPIGFRWSEMIRVFTPDGSETFHSLNPQMSYGMVTVGGCPGHLEPASETSLYQSAVKSRD